MPEETPKLPAHARRHRLPRTELWVGQPVFESLGWVDDLPGHIALANRMGWDYLFLPAGGAGRVVPGMNYRGFRPEEIKNAPGILPIGVVMNGPLGRLVAREGLDRVLLSWQRGIGARLEDEAGRTAESLAGYLAVRPSMVVIADDIAHQRAPYVRPDELREWLFPLYRPLAQAIHAAGACALFHSDGRIESVLPDLVEVGFDGLAGFQMDCQQEMLVSARNLVLLGGIDAYLLDVDIPRHEISDQFLNQVNTLRHSNRLILCSSSGIASRDELDRLETLYKWADEDVYR